MIDIAFPAISAPQGEVKPVPNVWPDHASRSI